MSEEIDLAEALLELKDILRDHMVEFLKKNGIKEMYTDDIRNIVDTLLKWFDGEIDDLEFVNRVQNILLYYTSTKSPSKIATRLLEHLKNVIRKACEELGIPTGEETISRLLG